MTPTSDPMPEFQALQYAFAAHLRDPGTHPAPEGIEERRLQIYRELFYNNIQDLLANNFPVIRKITPDERWHALVRGFFAEHASHTPLFTEIGREFHRYLEARAERDLDDPPFLPELAHYEWVELAVTLDEARIEDVPHDPDGDLVTGRPVVSPLAWPLAYRFPVHRIRADFQPDAPSEQPTLLLVARNRRDEVAFMEINAVSLRLLELMQENPEWSGLVCLNAVAELFPAAEREDLVAAGRNILAGFKARDVLLGTH